jgi:hypothetical protein
MIESGVGGSGGARVMLAGPVEREWCWLVRWSESGVGGSGGARVLRSRRLVEIFHKLCFIGYCNK